MHKISYILAGLFILIFSAVSFAAIPIQVSPGKGTIVTLKEPSKRVSIADPEIAQLTLLSPRELLINGKKTGITNLIIWDTAGKTTFFDVYVSICGDQDAIDKLEDNIRALAPESDIQVTCEGDTLVLRGEIKNRFTCKRGREPVVTRRDEAAATDIIETEEKDVCVETFQKIEQIAQFYSPKVLNLITIPEAEQIVLEIKVAQLDKTKLKELGVSWLAKGTDAEGFQNLIGAPTGSSTVTIADTGAVFQQTEGTGITGNVPGLGSFDELGPFQFGVSHFSSGIGVVLRALQEKGYGKILAEPNLVVRSGERGNFHVGSRIPIQTVTGTAGNQTVSIIYEEVGIRLNFEPKVLETDTIRLKIDPAEVSAVARFLTFQGVLAPEIDTRTVNTSVDLKEGESLILAGLLSEEMKKNIQKIPLLGDIPILGAIFRTSRDELTEKELAFFITPRRVKPLAPGVRPELPGEKQMTPEEEQEFQWMPLPIVEEEPEQSEGVK